MLKTDKQVIEQFKLLRSDEIAPAGPNFSDLVWAKVGHSSQSVFTPNSIFAVGVLCALLFVLVWNYNHAPSVSRKNLSEPVPIVGAMLEISPDLTHQVKSVVEEGDLLATGPEGQMTFFLPGVGYFHAAPESKMEIKKARYDANTGGFQYEISLQEGTLYSRLSKLESGASLNYFTDYGTVSVTGTDLLLNVKKETGLAVEVLNGEVKVISSKEPDYSKEVKEGFGALISPNTSGSLLVTELEGARLAAIKEEFTDIFKSSRSTSQQNGSNHIRILSHQEMRWKK